MIGTTDEDVAWDRVILSLNKEREDRERLASNNNNQPAASGTKNTAKRIISVSLD